MKTNRYFRIFMMALDTLVLFFLRLFRKFDSVERFRTIDKVTIDDEPYATENTDPEKLGIVTELERDGEPIETFERAEKIYFDPEESYSQYEGIVTFRGDNFRSGAAYGVADALNKRLEVKWSIDTGKLKKGYGSGYWTGSGWTGQPLIIRYDDESRARLDRFPEKKDKAGLTEAIYSTMDGNLYFIDIEDGQLTRDATILGLPFKGAGAVDPRKNAPIVYAGAGDSGPEEGQYARSFAVSLISGKKLFEFGGEDPFSLRKFHGYDSSHMVDKHTDTMIEPGENGILYTFKLNTVLNGETGDVICKPSDMVKLRYRTSRSTEEVYWLGMEDSSVIWKNYIYIADNGGNLMCIDLNTMKLIWAQDVADDTNGSPVFSVENNVPYIYIATSLHWTASKKLKLGDVPIFKINAINGEYVWIHKYLCNTVAGISGGIQATCAIGREGSNISNLVIFPVARTPQVRSGLLVALDKRTGKEVWRHKMKRYAWSSPVVVYSEKGKATIVQADSVGNLFLIDGATGAFIDGINLGSNIEASPAVFENTIVVGTRGQKIFGIEIADQHTSFV